VSKIKGVLIKYSKYFGLFLIGTFISYLGIITLEVYFPGIRLLFLLCIPPIYGLLKTKNEKLIVLLASLFVTVILSLIFPDYVKIL